MQMHRQVTPASSSIPWRESATAALANYRFYAHLHIRLFPYIYTYAKQPSRDRLADHPAARPGQPGRPEPYALQHGYRFGNEFLSPRCSRRTRRRPGLPARRELDRLLDQRPSGSQLITWNNANQSQIPLFVREGAIVPMLRTDVRTLCDANYVNNPQVSTMDGSWLIQAYPAGTSGFSAFDGTSLQCQGTAASGTITISSTARTITLRILGDQPTRSGATTWSCGAGNTRIGGSRLALRPAAGCIEIDFTHSGGTTIIEY